MVSGQNKNAIEYKWIVDGTIGVW